MDSKALRAQRFKLVTDARTLSAGDTLTPEQEVQFTAMMDEVDRLKARIDLVERADTAAIEMGEQNAIRAETLGLPAGLIVEATDAEKRAIIARLRHGEAWRAHVSPKDAEHFEAVTSRERRVMTAHLRNNIGSLSEPDKVHFNSRFGPIQASGATTSSGGGGYTVAPLFQREVLIALKAFGGVRAAARTIQTETGAILPWPTMDDTSQVAVIISTENADVGVAADLAFGTVSLGAFMYSTQALTVSFQLLQDSAFDFEALVKGAMERRFAFGQNQHFTTGTGTGQPQGVVTGSVVGKVGAAGQTTSVTYADLVDLEHSVDPAYRGGSLFMMHDSTLKVFKKMLDTVGRPLWLPGINVGAPDSLLGYPLSINQDMAAMAPNARSLLFGNFQNYIIRDTLGMQMMVLRERYAEKLQVGYIGYLRADGRIVSAGQPIKCYVNSAT